MEGSGIVKQLAVLLNASRGDRPLTLLLSTSVSLTPDVCQEVCNSTDWDVFQQCLQKDLGPGGRTEFLTHAFQQQQPPSGYQVLARLIKAGYFAPVFTCGPDSYLEDHLLALSYQPRVLVVGGHSNDYITSFLENQPAGPFLIKLHGSARETLLHPEFPEVRTFPAPLASVLSQYLNRQLVVVGSLAHDRAVARLLLGNRKTDLFYILPDMPDVHDDVRRTIVARGQQLANAVLTGEQGDFSTFFHTLEAHLNGEQPLNVAQSTSNATTNERAPVVLARADVLLVTVTEVETHAMLDLFPHATVLHHHTQTYYDLGLVSGARVYLVQQPKMGSDEAGGSTLTIYKGIQDLAPATVIMVGIAFGFEREKSAIGDILVSDQLQLYGHQRVGSDAQNQPVILVRNARPAVSPRLLSRFKSSAQSWQGQKVKFGVILSGNHLIDNMLYRDQIHAFAPEALGGEMEGAGLFAASQDHSHKVDWILVKAISDWADGKKSVDKHANQLKAARNAAQFVHHVLQQGGFTQT